MGVNAGEAVGGELGRRESGLAGGRPKKPGWNREPRRGMEGPQVREP